MQYFLSHENSLPPALTQGQGLVRALGRVRVQELAGHKLPNLPWEVPPALRGRQQGVDIYGSRPPTKLPFVTGQAHEGELHDGGLREPKPHLRPGSG